MKKMAAVLVLLLCVCLLPAYAEYEQGIWEIYEAENGMSLDFDNDGTEETVRIDFALNEYEDGDFLLTVGGKSAAVRDCVGLEQKLYAMKAGYTWYYYGTIFMVNEYGPSDDPLTYCFLYTEGELLDLGHIPALVRSFALSSDGVISTRIRAHMVGTWYRAADYVLSVGTKFDGEENWKQVYALSEVPRALYPMGMLVTTKTELALSSSLYEIRNDVRLAAGQDVLLVASDDVSRLFVTSLDGENRGWLAMRSEDWVDYILVNGRYTEIDDVFDNILYAD